MSKLLYQLKYTFVSALNSPFSFLTKARWNFQILRKRKKDLGRQKKFKPKLQWLLSHTFWGKEHWVKLLKWHLMAFVLGPRHTLYFLTQYFNKSILDN